MPFCNNIITTNPRAHWAGICQQSAGLTSTSPQTEVKDHSATLEMTYSQHVDSPPPSVVSGFLDRNYRYKSVATQIPHDYGLTSIPDWPKIDRSSDTFLLRFIGVHLNPRDHDSGTCSFRDTVNFLIDILCDN